MRSDPPHPVKRHVYGKLKQIVNLQSSLVQQASYLHNPSIRIDNSNILD